MGGKSMRRAAGLLCWARLFAVVAVIQSFVVPAAVPALGATDVPPVDGPACSICTSFVTTFDRDGNGTLPSFTRMHRDLVTNVAYVLDVDGSLPPAPFVPAVDVYAQVTVNDEPLLPTVGGYEIKATVQTLSGERPTVRLSKLLTAPEQLPLRIEIVTGDVDDPGVTKATFGYDTLSTTAPRSFVARLDLSDRDHNAATQQVKVGIEISVPGSRLTVVNESFTGNPADTRTNRHVRRAELIGDASRGTQVPSAVSLELTSSATRQHIFLTRKERTTLEFELSQPGGDPRSTGRIDELPPTIDLTISDEDVNGDGTADKKIDYAGGAIIGRAEFATKNALTTTKATVENLPMRAQLTYANPPGRTEIAYHADSRAARAQIDVADGEKTFSAALDNLPANINQLTHTSTPDGGNLVYLADASADRAEIHTSKGDATFDASVVGVPTIIDHLKYETPPDRVTVDHAASAAIPHAEVRFADLIAGSGTTPAHRRAVEVSVDGFPSSVDLTLDTAASKVHYAGSGRTPKVHVVVDDEQPLFERATKVDLVLEDVSPALEATLKRERFELEAFSFDANAALVRDRIGRLEVLGTNTLDQRLPPDEDGVLIRDFGLSESGGYTLFGRVRGLRHALYVPGENGLILEFDAAPPAGTDMVVDSQRDVRDQLWENEIAGTTPRSYSRDGTETIEARLRDYAQAITFDLDTAADELHVDYSAASAAGAMTFSRRTNYRGDAIPVTYKKQYTANRIAGSYPVSAFDSEMTAGLDPMPATFHACSVPNGDECSAGTWRRGMFEDFDPHSSANGGSVRLMASSRTMFTLDDRSTVSVPIAYTRLRSDVDEAGDSCERSIFFGFLCRYSDDKPGLATTHIALSLGDLIVQSHLESSGWVGRNVATMFAGDGANNQGYVAMDTGWRDAPVVTGDELCEALGEDSGCLIGGLLHGHYPPPEHLAIHGQIAKGGSACVLGEDCDALHNRFTHPDSSTLTGFGAKTDELALDYGQPFAAEHRVFEFDPDELIFAKHHSGHVYCGTGTSLKTGSSGFTSNFCEIGLPAASGS